MSRSHIRDPPCRRCCVPDVDVKCSYCRCRSGLPDANMTRNIRLPIASINNSSKFRQAFREVYAAQLQKAHQKQLAARKTLATKQLELIEHRAQIERDFQKAKAQIERDFAIAKAELQRKVEMCEESFRLREEHIMASGRSEVRSTTSQQNLEDERDKKQTRKQHGVSSISTMYATRTVILSGQDNQSITTSEVGTGVDSIECTTGESTSERAFYGMSQDDADTMSTLGNTRRKREESARTVVSQLPLPLTSSAQMCANVYDTHRNPISSSVRKSASKTNDDESCLHVIAGQQKVKQYQWMSVNQELCCQQLRRWTQEDVDVSCSPGSRNEQLFPLDKSVPLYIVSKMVHPRSLGKPYDDPLFNSMFTNIGRCCEYAVVENLEEKVWENTLNGQPGLEERRKCSTMLVQRGMCKVQPNLCSSLETVAQQIRSIWEQVNSVEICSQLMYETCFVSGPGKSTVDGSQVTEGAFKQSDARRGGRIWFYHVSEKNRLENVVTKPSARNEAQDEELGQTCAKRSAMLKCLAGWRKRWNEEIVQEKFQWFQFDPGGKASGVADSSENGENQNKKEDFVTSADRTSVGNNGPDLPDHFYGRGNVAAQRADVPSY